MKQRRRKHRILALVKQSIGKPRNWMPVGYIRNRPNSFNYIDCEIGRIDYFRIITSTEIAKNEV